MDTDHTVYPTITLADPDKKYPLRFRHKDIVELYKKHDIDITQRVSGIEAIGRIPTIIAQGLQHLGAAAPPFQEIVDYIEGLDVGELTVYTLAVAEAQKKASPEAQRALAALQAMAPATPTVQ